MESASPGGDVHVDDLTVWYWDGGDWAVACREAFNVTDGQAQEALLHDPAGNLTYDGRFHYTYDAWNRLAAIRHAFRDPNDPNSLVTGPIVGRIAYDLPASARAGWAGGP